MSAPVEAVWPRTELASAKLRATSLRKFQRRGSSMLDHSLERMIFRAPGLINEGITGESNRWRDANPLG